MRTLGLAKIGSAMGIAVVVGPARVGRCSRSRSCSRRIDRGQQPKSHRARFRARPQGRPKSRRRRGRPGGVAAPLCNGFSGHCRQGSRCTPKSPTVSHDARPAEVRSRPARATGSCSQALPPPSAKTPRVDAILGGPSKPASRAMPRPERCRSGAAFRRTRRTRRFLVRWHSCRQRSPSSSDFRISVGPYLRL